MLMAALFIIAKKYTEFKCPSKYAGMNEMWYILTIKYHLGIKKNEVWILATTRMNLKNSKLKERGQIQNVTYCTIQFIRNTQNKQILQEN